MSNSQPSVTQSRSRWGMIVALLIAGVLIATGINILSSPSTDATAVSPTTDAISLAVPTIAPTQQPAISPPAQKSPKATTTAKSIPAAAQPRRIQIPSAGIDIAVEGLPGQSLNGTVITPPENPSVVYWVSQLGFGFAGEGSTDTVVIAAHSGDDDKWVFNRLSNPALVKSGDLVIITTDNGVLTYKVSVTDHLARDEVGATYLKDSHPDNLLLISCFTADLHRQNRMVVASLVRK